MGPDDDTAAWQLWHRDTFDRETPASIEDRGTGLSSGLVSLWRRSLHSGVRTDGGATFSYFSLRWPGGSASVPVPPTGTDATLAKMRRWAFPPLAPNTPEPEAAWKDGCHTAPHDQDDAFLAALARLHLRLASEAGGRELNAAATRVIALVATMDDASAIKTG
jgi:hypothetical protein